MDLLCALGATRTGNVRISFESSRISRILDETITGFYRYVFDFFRWANKFLESEYFKLFTLDDPSTRESTFKAYQPVSNEQISQVIALQECLNTNTLGQLWTSSMPFLYPFIVQFRYILYFQLFMHFRLIF